MIHLDKTPRCFQVLQQCCPPLPQDEVDALDEADKLTEAALRRDGWWAAKAFTMFDKAIARQPERAAPAQFSQLQGHTVSIKPAPTQDVWLMESDLPDLIDQSPFGPDPGHGAFAASGLAQHAAALHIRAVVLVHFFSGFRREGDIHQILERRIETSGLLMFVLSVDLCLQREKAVLASRGSLR